MSSINVSNLVTVLLKKINEPGNSEAEILYYSKAIELLKSGKVFVVNRISELPDFEQNAGALYYVKDESTVYFVNPTYGWIEIYRSFATELFLWGQGASGQLANGSLAGICSPVREICCSNNWCQVSVGCRHTTAVKTNGQIWSWGYTGAGRLGDGTAPSSIKSSPVREICNATDWCQVSSACAHTLAIKTGGQLWGWGLNSDGQLGTGTTVTTCSPVREISSSTDWCQVCSEDRDVVAVKTSGQLWSWGTGCCGRLGDGSTTNKCSPVREISSSTDWCQVSAGVTMAAAVKTTGQIWTWGNGQCGRLGNGSIANVCSPVREISSSTDWCQAGAGKCAVSSIKTTGQLWSWGKSASGLLGDGSTTDKCSPVREICSATDWCQVDAGAFNSAAVKTSGELWSWGCNVCGILGDGSTTSKCSPVREVSSSTDWCQVNVSTLNTAAIKVRNL